MRCVILAAGEHFAPPTLLPQDLIIAADGGLDFCARFGIAPAIAIGDFDSAEAPAPSSAEVIALPREKDITDTRAAADLGLARGCDSFAVYGGLGGRLSHTLANLALAAELAGRGKSCELFGERSVVTAIINSRLEFDASESGYLSVFAFGGIARGVCLRGLKYPLENAALSPDVALGVSNEFIGKKSTVEVVDGTLIIIKEA